MRAPVALMIGKKIKALREAKGLSQEALARSANLSTSVVARLEQGKIADPQWSTMCALADALGADLADFRQPPDGDDS